MHRVDLRRPPRHDGGLIREDLGVATAFEEVMGVRRAFSGLEQPLAEEVATTGADPVFSTRFKIGETCAAVLGGVGVAVSDIWEMKTGRRQKVSIDVRHAAAGLRSSVYMQRPDARWLVQARGQQEPRSDDSDHSAVADEGRTLGAAAFRSAEFAGSNAEAAGLRAQCRSRSRRPWPSGTRSIWRRPSTRRACAAAWCARTRSGSRIPMARCSQPNRSSRSSGSAIAIPNRCRGAAVP